jgi:acyl-CoA dehydrogenase
VPARRAVASLLAVDEHPTPRREVDERTPYPAILVELRAKVKTEGLWNLFLPHAEFGPGLTNAEYGVLCEEMGRSTLVAPYVFNCLVERFSALDDLAGFHVPDSSAESVRVREELLSDARY